MPYAEGAAGTCGPRRRFVAVLDRAYAGMINCEAFLPRRRSGAVLAAPERISIWVCAVTNLVGRPPARLRRKTNPARVTVFEVLLVRVSTRGPSFCLKLDKNV